MAERRRKLIDAAIQLYGTQGYHNTTVRGICAAAHLSERYFYESFSSSEELLLTTFDLVVERVLARIEAAIAATEPTADAMMRAALTTYYADSRQNSAVARLTLIELRTVSTAADAAYRDVQRRIAALLERIISMGDTRVPKPGLSSDLLSTALAAAFNGLALAWAESGYERSLDEMIRTSLAVYTSMASLWRERPAASGISTEQG
jgi:AcrR family transcriptional regulator